jgi:hypothetical protein
MTKQIIKAVLCSLLLVGGCGGGDEAVTGDTTGTDTTAGSEGTDTTVSAEPVTPPVETPPPPAPAHLRLINASPDAAAASLALFVDGAATPAAAPLAYKAATAYLELSPGVHPSIVRSATAAADAAPLFEGGTQDLAAGTSYTVIAYAPAGGAAGLVGTPAVDDGPAPDATHASLRFFHALVGVANVDICLPGATARAAGTPVFTNVAYGQFGAWASVPAGAAVTLQIRAANEATPCSGRQAGSVSITPTSGVFTAVAVGRATGRPAVAKELLLVADGASEVTTVAIGR